LFWDFIYNYTPLHFAACNGHLNVIEFLVKQNVDLNIKEKNGKTPLVLASEKGKWNVVEFLKNHGGE